MIRVFGMSLLPYPILSSSLLHPSMCSMQETSKPPVTPLNIDLWTLNLPPQKQDPVPKGIAGPREEQNWCQYGPGEERIVCSADRPSAQRSGIEDSNKRFQKIARYSQGWKSVISSQRFYACQTKFISFLYQLICLWWFNWHSLTSPTKSNSIAWHSLSQLVSISLSYTLPAHSFDSSCYLILLSPFFHSSTSWLWGL